MPQMAPMSWLVLFMFFSLMLIMFSTMNYYHYIPMIQKSEKMGFKKKTMNWKW